MEALQQVKETMLHPLRKKDGGTPHTLHKTRRVQQFNNLEGNMHKETMPQQVVSDERSQIQTTAVAQPYNEKEREKL